MTGTVRVFIATSLDGFIAGADDDLSGLRNAVVGCIGPSTAEAAERCGLTPTVVAEHHTIPGLVGALRSYFQRS